MRKPLPLLGKLIFDLSRYHQRTYIVGPGLLVLTSYEARTYDDFLEGILSHPSPHNAAHFWDVPAIQYDLPCFRSRERQGFQPSIAHWTILLAEIVPVPRAYLGGFPDSISLATSPARFRPDRELHLISNFCLFSHQSHDFWFPKSVDQADGGNRTKRKLKYPLKD